MASDKLIAVADGVGGWASEGIDSGLFSKQLCKDIHKIFHSEKLTLKQVLVKAVAMN